LSETGPERIFRNAVDVIPREELGERLNSGDPLRIKLGIDPTAPDIHLGFAVVLGKLREFQDLGHTAVLIIGDYTARIGDPSGRSKERPVLSGAELDRNARDFAEQAFTILDREKTEIRHNGEWLGKLSYEDIVGLARHITVARLLERDDFAKRFAAHEPISLSELLYPMMQGYDSVAVRADVELGGTDQLYNLLAGRSLMEAHGMKPQAVFTLPLLVGTDGKWKMSKSRGNYIGISDPPEEQFGKVMSLPDDALEQYWRLCLGEGPPNEEPMESKLALARGIVGRYHGAEEAERAEENFTRTVRRRETPEDMPEVELPDEEGIWIVDLITLAGFAKTNGEARRFIKGGAVRVGGEVFEDEKASLDAASLDGAVLRVGKRRYARLSARK
jgi:tyrosyl-tRNA synthetase